MALILSIETSTASCSVALHHQGKLLAVSVLHAPNTAASHLTGMIEEVMLSSSHAMNELSGVAVSAGPGSYTGLRIGTSTAKGICFGLRIPLLAIGSLRILALQAPQGHDLVCPMIDARRMEVYCSLFDDKMTEIQSPQARIIEKESFADELDRHTIHFIGDGAAKCSEIIRHPNANFSNGRTDGAAAMGGEAYRKYLANETQNLGFYEPFYLKEFVAKTKSV
ncbi:MAG: tRNA (adenosine(37)-N6)-threonylcarbamoyltransferase complex dimerization subunit type 1 TsaB [Bacteroidetes bacterium]|nr:tRNA (adenosine(37)-N6)-threonylcarbamoyltransferase complex dimerization subunit type 1 TsaB [Bacteroidota bacterium]